METMTLNEWVLWRNILEKLNKAAADEYRDSVWHIRGRYQGKGLGAIPRTELVDLAYSLVAKHGVSESDTEAAIRKLDELKDAYEIVKRRKSTEGIMNVNNKSDVLQESTKSAQEQGHFKKPDKVPNQTNLKGGTKVREPIIYGYCRISTPTQSIDRQVRNIKKDYPSAHIIMDTYTGTTQNRRKWGWLLSQVCPGDTIVFDSVSRMSRNAEEGVSEYFALIERNITLKFLKEPYINSDVYLESKADKIELTGSDEDEIFKGLNNYFHRLAAKQIRITGGKRSLRPPAAHQRRTCYRQTERKAGWTDCRSASACKKESSGKGSDPEV